MLLLSALSSPICRSHVFSADQIDHREGSRVGKTRTRRHRLLRHRCAIRAAGQSCGRGDGVVSLFRVLVAVVPLADQLYIRQQTADSRCSQLPVGGRRNSQAMERDVVDSPGSKSQVTMMMIDQASCIVRPRSPRPSRTRICLEERQMLWLPLRRSPSSLNHREPLSSCIRRISPRGKVGQNASTSLPLRRLVFARCAAWHGSTRDSAGIDTMIRQPMPGRIWRDTT